MKKRFNHKQAKWTCTATILCCLLFGACKKQDDWLNAKRIKSDITPSTVVDFQAILDNNVNMNGEYPGIELLGTDNFYVTDANLSGSSEQEINSYTWAKDIYQNEPDYTWTNLYVVVEDANIVLDGLKKITGAEAATTAYNNVKGSALFFRAFAFYYLAQIYSKPYSKTSASSDPGIPLRLTSDVTVASTRATVQETYDQILKDLKSAVSLLPESPLFASRPSQPAANGLLAKVYLDMDDYTDAGAYANTCLGQNGKLLDYNDASLASVQIPFSFPSFTTGNPEVIFFAYGGGYSTIEPLGTGYVDTMLYRTYSNNDLRKTLYYSDNGSGLISFIGNYAANYYDFSGIANDEIYLIRAECYARAGNANAALADLNELLSKRYVTGSFTPYTTSDSQTALKLVLAERRKELPFTGVLRWEDLRRLNKEPAFAVTVTHKYNSKTYTLPPNDNRYVYPIPDQEVQIDHLEQNPR